MTVILRNMNLFCISCKQIVATIKVPTLVNNNVIFVGVVLYNFRHHLRSKNRAPCVKTTPVRPSVVPSVRTLCSTPDRQLENYSTKYHKQQQPRTYNGGSKRFRPDIQKPRQMENAARDIQGVPGGTDQTSGECSLC